MKLTKVKTISLALATSAMLWTTSMQAQLMTSYTNNFDLGANTASFSASGSVASWIYWYNTPGGNTAMTCLYGQDAEGQTNTSGCLEVDSPFSVGGNDQNVFFGTFGNGYGYDFSVRANFNNYSNITFKIKMAPGISPDTSTNYGNQNGFGNIGVGYIDHGYSYHEIRTLNIPPAAATNWVPMICPLDYSLANLADVPGLAFRIDNYSSYINFPFTNYIDDVRLNLSPVQTPPPKLSGTLQKPVTGLNEIATTSGSGGQYDRYQLATVADSGYTFVGNASVTYSWTIDSFPQGTGGNFQQHFFIVNGAPGQYDQAADYNLADCIFITVQQSDAGVATFNFRYKTNQPAGNAMLFNTVSPTNAAVNSNGWPVMPFCQLVSSNGALGTWSVTFVNTTNVTLAAPDGSHTNFVFDPASAALFADPVTLLLGGQPNNPNGAGKAVVYGAFAALGCATPYSETFSNETSLNTNIWKDLSNDPNGDVFVPPGSAYWLSWSVPDGGFSPQDAATVNATATNWMDLSLLTILDNGKRTALLPAASLPAGPNAFFRLLQRTFSQLQVLLPGENNAPNTGTGKTGSPTPIPAGTIINVVVNAVDSTFHIIPGVGDTISLSSNDGAAVIGANAAMNNGTVSIQVQLNTAQTNITTVTATDITTTNIPPATSSTITVQ